MELVDNKKCTGCSACVSVCPKRCIRMEPDVEGFLRPVVEREICVDCGLCRKVCPVLSSVRILRTAETVAYAAYNLDSVVREQSTSGGIFTELCKWVLAQGGIVFGAAYDENFRVKHYMVDNESELWRLRGAKYAQSDLSDCFLQIKMYLESGRKVLFSGTPCQVVGLQQYLGRVWEQLLLVDVVCHGVPSPAVWKQYIQYRSEIDADGNIPSAINLRSKKTGWPGYSVLFDYSEHSCYSALNFDDPYMRVFVGNLCLRPSCYDCSFKGVVRTSDFTLADYWGIERQIPELYDGKGTSLVLLHSEKAKQVWQDLFALFCSQQVDPKQAVVENPSAVKSSARVQNRESFMARYAQEDFEKLANELLPHPSESSAMTLFRRIIGKVKRII